MNENKVGCQTYTWQMSFEKYKGKVPHILDTIKASGLQGIEPETCMLGAYYEDPASFIGELNKRKLELSALCLVLPWKNNKETESERMEAEKAMNYLRHFPGTLLILCQYPGEDRSDLAERQKNALSCINSVAERASENGIISAFHPNSPAGSIFRTCKDYEILLDGIDSRFLGFCPDAGHIAKGGMDVLDIFKTYHSLIRHVHFKDISPSGKWMAMGKGFIDFPSVMTFLNESGYRGWIMIEEESEKAETNPDEVTLENGRYVKSFLSRFL